MNGLSRSFNKFSEFLNETSGGGFLWIALGLAGTVQNINDHSTGYAIAYAILTTAIAAETGYKLAVERLQRSPDNNIPTHIIPAPRTRRG